MRQYDRFKRHSDILLAFRYVLRKCYKYYWVMGVNGRTVIPRHDHPLFAATIPSGDWFFHQKISYCLNYRQNFAVPLRAWSSASV